MPPPKRVPALAQPGEWQADRRNALTLLTTQIERAHRAARWPNVDAFRFARRDVLDTLRERAAAVIAESTEMRHAHTRLVIPDAPRDLWGEVLAERAAAARAYLQSPRVKV